ncbi:MAG: PEP/pyruvate-binding domain-containing protein [Bacteroidia bacterium]
MKYNIFLLFSIFFTFLGCSQTTNENCLYKGGHLDFLPAIKCPEDFDALEGLPLAQKYGNVKAIKVIYDLSKRKLYYVSGKKYKFHWDFCHQYLRVYHEEEISRFCEIEYSNHPSRKYILGNLNHYEGPDIYTLEFFSDDRASAELVTVLFNSVQKTTYFGNKLKLLLNSAEIEQKASKLNLPKLAIDSLYASQLYQPLNKAIAYGYLRKVSVKDFKNYSFSKQDIILTDGLPNDFPLVQGIITTQFQTPLCHINLLSNNRGTPNAAMKTAWNDSSLNLLVGKLVYYEVTEEKMIVKPTTEAEAKVAWQPSKLRKSRQLVSDTSYRKLLDIKELNYKKANLVGTKAANFGELARAFSYAGKEIQVPEGGFAIPFYFYWQHLQKNKLLPLIDNVIQQAKNQDDRQVIAKLMKELRDTIVACPIDKLLLESVQKKMATTAYQSFRFRSSTNAEDISGFNGAGLYDSKTGTLNSKEKSVEHAIKKVWASAWNVRAFEERAHFNMEQKGVAMAILCHRSFGDEAANGVAITQHLYRKDYPAYTINVQEGETSVVLPSDSVVCEQFVLSFSSSVTGRPDLGIDYLSKSSLTKGKNVLSEKEIAQLTDALKGIKQHFYYETQYGSRNKTDLHAYENYGLDIEFKLEAKTRKLYIKQARMYYQ